MTRILIAEDEQSVREVLRTVLDAAPDLTVIGEASNGPEALEACERLDPEVLLLDLNMPGLNGIDVTRQLRPLKPGLVIIILSGYARPDLVQAALQAGATEFVKKPVRGPDLVSTIRSTVERFRKTTVAPVPPGPPVSEGPAGKLLGVFGPRDGMGATTVAVNLATTLAQREASRVLLVDLDLRFSDASYLVRTGAGEGPPGARTEEGGLSLASLEDEGEDEGATPDPPPDSILQLLAPRQVPSPEAFTRQIHHSDHGVFLLSGPPKPALAHPSDALLAGTLQVAVRLFEYVIVDFPAIFYAERLRLMGMLQSSFLVVANDLPSARAARVLMGTFADSGFPVDRLQVLENRLHGTRGLSTRALQESLACPVRATLPQDVEGARESFQVRAPLVLIQNSDLVTAFEIFVDEEYPPPEAPPPPPPPEMGGISDSGEGVLPMEFDD